MDWIDKGFLEEAAVELGLGQPALWAEPFRRECPGLGSARFPAPTPLYLPLAGCGTQGEFASSRDLIFLICQMDVRSLPLRIAVRIQ